MSLNAKDVAEILQALEASTFDTLELQMGDVKLSLRRSGAPAPGAAPAHTHEAPPAGAAAPAIAKLPPVEIPPGTQPVPSPLLGVFYRAPRPGDAPYVEVGQRVQADTIVGIIEVMKLMNTVRAGLAGEIVAIAARNGELVEFGEALLFVRPD